MKFVAPAEAGDDLGPEVVYWFVAEDAGAEAILKAAERQLLCDRHVVPAGLGLYISLHRLSIHLQIGLGQGH